MTGPKSGQPETGAETGAENWRGGVRGTLARGRHVGKPYDAWW